MRGATSLLVVISLSFVGSAAVAWQVKHAGHVAAAADLREAPVAETSSSAPVLKFDVPEELLKAQALVARYFDEKGLFPGEKDLSNLDAYNPTRVPLTPESRSRLGATIEALNGELRGLQSEIQEIEQRLADEKIEKGEARPYEPSELRINRENAIYAIQYVSGQGAFFVRIDPDEHPGLQNLLNVQREIRREGVRTLRSFFVNQ